MIKTNIIYEEAFDSMLNTMETNYCKKLQKEFRCFDCQLEDCIFTDYMDEEAV
jgi:hypothetical protein